MNRTIGNILPHQVPRLLACEHFLKPTMLSKPYRLNCGIQYSPQTVQEDSRLSYKEIEKRIQAISQSRLDLQQTCGRAIDSLKKELQLKDYYNNQFQAEIAELRNTLQTSRCDFKILVDFSRIRTQRGLQKERERRCKNQRKGVLDSTKDSGGKEPSGEGLGVAMAKEKAEDRRRLAFGTTRVVDRLQLRRYKSGLAG